MLELLTREIVLQIHKVDPRKHNFSSGKYKHTNEWKILILLLMDILLMIILLMIIVFMKNLSDIFLYIIPHVRKIYISIDEQKKKMPVKKKINIQTDGRAYTVEENWK